MDVLKKSWTAFAGSSSVPRPKYIAELHEVRYDLHFCSEAEEAGKSAKYDAALAKAARIAGVSEHDLRKALWMKQERLSKPSRK